MQSRPYRTAKPRRRRHIAIPPELLYDIMATVIMETIDSLVYSDDEVFYNLWQNSIKPLLLVSSTFNATVLVILSHALDIEQHDDKRLSENPVTIIYRMRVDVADREDQVSKWLRAESIVQAPPMMYEGCPLARLYHLSEYGPWYFFTRAKLCSTVEELQDLQASVLSDANEMATRFKFPKLSEFIERRRSRVVTHYRIGFKVMECCIMLKEIHNSLDHPTVAAMQRCKEKVPELAKKLASRTRNIDTEETVQLDIARLALSYLMAVLKVSNNPDTDRSVQYLFSVNQPALIEQSWYEAVRQTATHAQRDRLLRAAPLGFLPVDVSSPRLEAFRDYLQNNS